MIKKPLTRIMEDEGASHRNRHIVNYLPNTFTAALTTLALLLIALFLIFYVDRPLAFFVERTPESIKTFFSYVTLFGRSTKYLVFFGTAFLLLYPASKSEKWASHGPILRKYALISFFIFVSIALSGILTDILKVIFARYRPVVMYRTGDFGFVFFKLSPAKVLSFPSGHANTIAAFMTALYFFKPRYLLFYLFIVLMVMASRVIIGEHFISDVVVGAYLGIFTTVYLKGLFSFFGIDIFDISPLSHQSRH